MALSFLSRVSAVLASFLILAGGASAATINVNETNDTTSDPSFCIGSNGCSLREAILTANAQSPSASTIHLPPGDYQLTISGANLGPLQGDLNFTNTLTIDGAGASQTTIDATGLGDRIFHAMCPTTLPCTSDQTSLTINGVTLVGGTGTADTLDSQGATNFVGGAILFDTGGTLTINDSVLAGNDANGPSGADSGQGGAIYMFDKGASLVVSGSTFTNNHAIGGTTSGFGVGGAVDAESTAGSTVGNVTITNSTFAGNIAGGGGGSDNGEGGAIKAENQSLTITGSAFTGNQAGGGGGSANGEGGATYTETGDVTVTGSTFSGNSAGGGGSSADGEGGAIRAEDGTVTIQSSRLAGNVAGGGGGMANGEGGAVRSENGPVNVSGSVFTGNVAGGGGGEADGEGGAIDSFFGGFAVTSSVVSGNTAGVGATASSSQGGGLFSSADSPDTIVGSTISGNASGGQGGYGEGGGIDDTAVNVTNSTIAGNTAGGGGASGDGGGIDSIVTLSSSTVAGNTAGSGTGVAGGGGIDGALTLHNSILAGNLVGGSPNNCSGGPVTSHGHNIEDGTSCALSAPGDRSSINPMLAPLGDYGGGQPTMALLPGSPAIDAGDNNGCPATDERGVTRPQPAGGACDIGAYEYSPPATSSASAQWSCTATGHVTFTVTATAGGASPSAVDYTLDGGAQQRVPTSGNPATATIVVAGGPQSLTFWGESQGGALEATHHTVALHCTPLLSGLGIHPGSFHAAAAGASIVPAKHAKTCAASVHHHHVTHPKSCATVTYTDTLAATTTFTVERVVFGVKTKHGCVTAKSHHHHHLQLCIKKVVTLPGSFTFQDAAGANSFVFSGRLNGHALAPGSYRLVATPSLGGTKGAQAMKPFAIS